ncbi:hypothetical protein TNCV_2509791 [Trichonephila clavipes]|nr:hypothetical protein TNCV_2509791 [Trichonephila clavipes]
MPAVLAATLSTILYKLARFHTSFEGEQPGGGHRVSYPSYPSTNPRRGLAAVPLFRVPPAEKALYICKHPCLLRDSNPGPTVQQSASLTTIPDGRLIVYVNRITVKMKRKLTLR